MIEDRMGRWRDRWDRSMAVLRAPRVTIAMYGDQEARAAYEAFTARHPRFRVTSAKRWGVALLVLPDSFDDYVAGSSKAYLRRQSRRAEKAGYRHASVDPLDHLDEILEINRSAPSRQGRAMTASYLDRDAVARTFGHRAAIEGILDKEGRLRAYADALPLGDVILLSRILGHADHLEHGTMYLLVSELVRAAIERRRRLSGEPTWVMYDTFWGASRGLAYFKERCGFMPYSVKWVWVDRGPADER
jgi:hypothetical protein